MSHPCPHRSDFRVNTDINILSNLLGPFSFLKEINHSRSKVSLTIPIPHAPSNKHCLQVVGVVPVNVCVLVLCIRKENMLLLDFLEFYINTSIIVLISVSSSSSVRGDANSTTMQGLA